LVLNIGGGLPEQEECDPTITSLRDYIRFLINDTGWCGQHGGKLEQVDYEILAWPPDVFVIAATLLRSSAGYLWLANNWPPSAQDLAAIGFPLGKARTSATKNDLWRYVQQIETVAAKWKRHADACALPESDSEKADLIENSAKLHDFKAGWQDIRPPDTLRESWPVLKRAASRGLHVRDLGNPRTSSDDESSEEIRKTTLALLCLLAAANQALDRRGTATVG
jgi:hypothetical protein